MTIGERIKEKRLELKMSQDELAKKAGYSDKSAICKFERGGNEITMKQLKRVALALGVSSAYLMGWENTEDQPYSPDILITKNTEISAEEMCLIELYRNADKETKVSVYKILDYSNIMKKIQGKEENNDD